MRLTKFPNIWFCIGLYDTWLIDYFNKYYTTVYYWVYYCIVYFKKLSFEFLVLKNPSLSKFRTFFEYLLQIQDHHKQFHYFQSPSYLLSVPSFLWSRFKNDSNSSSIYKINENLVRDFVLNIDKSCSLSDYSLF